MGKKLSNNIIKRAKSGIRWDRVMIAQSLEPFHQIFFSLDWRQYSTLRTTTSRRKIAFLLFPERSQTHLGWEIDIMILFADVFNEQKSHKKYLLLTGSQIPRWLEARRWWRTSRERKRKKVDASRSRAFTGCSLKRILCKEQENKDCYGNLFYCKIQASWFQASLSRWPSFT